MKAQDFISELEQLGYNVEKEIYNRDYNAKIHYVNVEGNYIGIEHIFNGNYVDEVSERERITLLCIINAGIKEGKYLVSEESCPPEKSFMVCKWGGLTTSLFTLSVHLCDCDKFYVLDNVDKYQELSDLADGFYGATAMCGNEPKIYSYFLAQLRLNGIKIYESNAIKDMRIYRGLSQKELAEKTGLTQSKISAYENCDDFSNITVGSIKAIADALDCSIDTLI